MQHYKVRRDESSGQLTDAQSRWLPAQAILKNMFPINYYFATTESKINLIVNVRKP